MNLNLKPQNGKSLDKPNICIGDSANNFGAATNRSSTDFTTMLLYIKLFDIQWIRTYK